MTTQPPEAIVQAACHEADKSPCRSQRGAAIWTPTNSRLVSVGHNNQVSPLACDTSDECKASCRRTAVHAEQAALLRADRSLLPYCDMLHVKVTNGMLVQSGPPSCVECSKLVAAARLGMWLYHSDGWRRYGPSEFHRLSVKFSMGDVD